MIETQPTAAKRKQLLSQIANSKNPKTLVILKSKAMTKLKTAMTKLSTALLKFLKKKQLRVIIAKVQMCLPPSVVVKCPICRWYDNQKICPNIPMDRKHMKDMFTRCYNCGSVKHIKMRNSKETFYSPSDNEGESNILLTLPFLVHFALYI